VVVHAVDVTEQLVLRGFRTDIRLIHVHVAVTAASVDVAVSSSSSSSSSV